MSRRIGEVLIELGLLTPGLLERALVKQRTSGGRLCSVLIDARVITFDDAARALGEFHGVHAVLAKHLEGRDHALAAVLPAAVAHATCALPIGRLRSGAVVVCVRDPSPAMAARLTDATGEAIVLAVAPAGPLARAVADTYPTSPAAALAAASADGVVEAYDVDMTSGPIPVLHSASYEVDLSTGPLPTIRDDDEEDGARAMAALGSLAALSLVGLDDRSVTRDASQSAIQIGPRTRTELPPADPSSPPQRPSASSLPPATSSRPQLSSLSNAGIALPRTMTPPSLSSAGIALPRTTTPPAGAPRPTPPQRTNAGIGFDQALALVSVARTLPQATEAVMAFAAGRWAAALLLRLQGGAARGELGHGARLPLEAVLGLSVPLDEPSLVTAALRTPGVVSQPPAGAGELQDRLEGLLGLPRVPAAASARIGEQVAYVLLVGDPASGSGDERIASAELGQLMAALGAACARIATRA